MSLISFAFAKSQRAEAGDWSQQELGEIYRVLRLLQQSGLSIEIDRGVTDLNEPWCVYFDPDVDDVFLHIARLSGEYLFVSDQLGLKVAAATFRAASAKFESAINNELRNNERRGGNVIAHPASQLMYSLAAIFLIVKTKSADAAATGADEIQRDAADFVKVRAILNRLQEASDNPLLVAAMISAIVLSTSSVGTLEVPDIDEQLLSGTLTDGSEHSGDATQSIDSNEHDHVTLAASEALPDVRKLAEDEAEQVAEDETGLHININAHEIGVIADYGMSGEVEIAGLEKDPAGESNTATLAIEDQSLADEALELNGSGAYSPSEQPSFQEFIVKAFQTDSYVVLDTDVTDLSEFTALAMSADADELAPILLASTSDDAGFANEVETSPEIAQRTGEISSAPVMPSDPWGGLADWAVATVKAFGDVDVFTYGQGKLLIVDADVKYMSGADLAFVSADVSDGGSIALIGGRDVINAHYAA
ncbi:hypothetical protein JM93_01984 [Roseibium hamelinense]|uniref:Uncharacterized protein n=1 Tax=Roseibium hamelinense TaxID=150831 RepID=A0A562T1A1_9HYPH|nr:hypothetical protein [Roseibium hamelinense]MTI44452.1 hypothetical protein [Roseibium hamelinense]TWI87419.1 hypothetical protein JM93_01984 [Roseibium hamelinense]